MAIMLEAMRIGLAPTRLARDGRFQRDPPGFMGLAILVPLLGVFIVLLLGLAVVIFNMLYIPEKGGGQDA